MDASLKALHRNASAPVTVLAGAGERDWYYELVARSPILMILNREIPLPCNLLFFDGTLTSTPSEYGYKLIVTVTHDAPMPEVAIITLELFEHADDDQKLSVMKVKINADGQCINANHYSHPCHQDDALNTIIMYAPMLGSDWTVDATEDTLLTPEEQIQAEYRQA